MNFFLVSDPEFEWDELVAWGLAHQKAKVLRVCKLAWWSSLYHIWLQKNAIMHASKVWCEKQSLKSIRRNVSARLDFKANFQYSAMNSNICKNWGLDPAVMLCS